MDKANQSNSKNQHGIFEPFATEKVPWEDFSHGKFGMRYQQLGNYGGGTKLGVCMEILEPGKQANQSHYHLLEEEHLYVLEGEMTLTLGDKSYVLQVGSYVCFPAGQNQGHSITNHSPCICRYLVMSDRNPNDVIIYPETDKVSVRATGEIYQKSAVLDYWANVDD